MIDVLKHLNQELKKVTPESYLELNTAQKVVYPYVTYEVDQEALNELESGFNIDIDIFDNSSSYKNILLLEEKIIDVFDHRRAFGDGFLIMFDYERSSFVRTGEENIKRKNVQIYARVIWR